MKRIRNLTPECVDIFIITKKNETTIDTLKHRSIEKLNKDMLRKPETTRQIFTAAKRIQKLYFKFLSNFLQKERNADFYSKLSVSCLIC